MTNELRLPLTPDTFASIIALQILAAPDDHIEFDMTDHDELAQSIFDDMRDLYHNANFDIFTPYFIETFDIDLDIATDMLYALLMTDTTSDERNITDIAASIIRITRSIDHSFSI